ncbi:hypothetical protein AGMMS50233_07810 [Endomicrobiia bacterium]|nr:hypothetical protein AGMMS50233_07810 [Endomicrobiia bacterium]
MKKLLFIISVAISILLFSCKSPFKTLAGTSWISVTEYRKITLEFTSDKDFNINYLDYNNGSNNFSNGTYVYDNPEISITYAFSGNGRETFYGTINGSAMIFSKGNEQIIFLIDN